jgi:anti-anti-sigma regulatory factor
MVEIVVSHRNGRVPVSIFRIKGELTLESCEQLQQKAEDAHRAGMRNLVLDLTDVGFLSSSGLRVIHRVFNLLRADIPEESDETMRTGIKDGTFTSPHLKLLNPSPQVLNTLKLAGFDMFLEIHSDLQQALSSF